MIVTRRLNKKTIRFKLLTKFNAIIYI